jgi:hypothetical protein
MKEGDHDEKWPNTLVLSYPMLCWHNHVKNKIGYQILTTFFGGILNIYKVPSKYTIEL